MLIFFWWRPRPDNTEKRREAPSLVVSVDLALMRTKTREHRTSNEMHPRLGAPKLFLLLCQSWFSSGEDRDQRTQKYRERHPRLGAPKWLLLLCQCGFSSGEDRDQRTRTKTKTKQRDTLALAPQSFFFYFVRVLFPLTRAETRERTNKESGTLALAPQSFSILSQSFISSGEDRDQRTPQTKVAFLLLCQCRFSSGRDRDQRTQT